MRARSKLLARLLPLLGGTVLAACSAVGPGAGAAGADASPSRSDPASTTAGSALSGRTFVSTGVTGRLLAGGTRVTLAFQATTLSASAGCNTMGGDYHLAGSTLEVGSLAMTDMACQGDRMAQDGWLANLLPGATVRLAGTTLALSKGDVSVDLVDRKTTSLPLEGTVWTVDGIASGDAVGSVPQGVRATIAIEGGEARVYTGCNWGSLTVTFADGKAIFGPVAMTARGCAHDGSKAVEQAMLTVLEGAQPYTVDGDSLTIGAVGGAAVILKGATATSSAQAS